MIAKLVRFYEAIFSVDEIASDRRNQALFYGLIPGFLISFYYWFSDLSITTEAVEMGEHICLPYFQNCSSLYFHSIHGLLSPQNWYIFLTALLGVSLWAGFKKKWTLAHFIIALITLWKLIYLFLFTNNAGTDYEFFHLPVLLVFLFSNHKFYFSRLIFVMVYSTAAAMKFDTSWIAATYFSSLKDGLPLFGHQGTLLITNAVIVFEIIGSWTLLSSYRKVRNTTLALWIVFHLYSVLIVGYRYPLHCLALIVPLFALPAVNDHPKISFKNLVSYLLILLVYLSAYITLFIPGDTKYHLKNMKFGVRMFDANHQCYSEMFAHTNSGETIDLSSYNVFPMRRCQPYTIWYKAQNYCRRSNVKYVTWSFYSSVNGGPFYQLVKSDNICGTDYKIFSSNEWYNEPANSLNIAGYPKKNNFNGGAIETSGKQIINNVADYQPQDVAFFINENIKIFQTIYWVIWTIINLVVCYLFLSNSKWIRKL